MLRNLNPFSLPKNYCQIPSEYYKLPISTRVFVNEKGNIHASMVKPARMMKQFMEGN